MSSLTLTSGQKIFSFLKLLMLLTGYLKAYNQLLPHSLMPHSDKHNRSDFSLHFEIINLLKFLESSFNSNKLRKLWLNKCKVIRINLQKYNTDDCLFAILEKVYVFYWQWYMYSIEVQSHWKWSVKSKIICYCAYITSADNNTHKRFQCIHFILLNKILHF